MGCFTCIDNFYGNRRIDILLLKVRRQINRYHLLMRIVNGNVNSKPVDLRVSAINDMSIYLRDVCRGAFLATGEYDHQQDGQEA